MSDRMRLTLNTKASERAFARLQERAPAAIARALNRAADSATTAMIRVISADTGIRQKDLRGTTKRNRTIWASRAAPGRPVATVYANTTRIPLADFNARGPGGATAANPVPSRGRGRGVTAGLRGGAKRYRDLFFATMRSGHVGVFGRMGQGERRSPKAWSRNLPIAERFGPSIARVWQRHAQIGVDRARQQLLKNLAHEFQYATSRAQSPAPSQ